MSRRPERSEGYKPAYLTRSGFKALVGLAETLVAGPDEVIAPEQVAENVDRYMLSFNARRKWTIKLALVGLQFYPLLTLKPPLSRMSPEKRLAFIKKRFITRIERRRITGVRAVLLQAMIRLGQQMAFLGYYGDARTFDSVGYTPFSKRPRYAEAMKAVEQRRPKVTTVPHDQLDGEIEADVAVIGTGAAGSIIAEKLAEAGRSVLMLERGMHVDPSDFSEDEVEMISKLYADGALQLSRDFRFQILQGMCVGGSTVVNNAVCFEIPDEVMQRWNGELGAGLDEQRLRDAFAAIRARLRIVEQPDANLNPGAAKFVDGVGRLELNDPTAEFGIVHANIADCLGCGYCNIGCAYGKKLSMLDTVLPEAQAKYGDRLRIVADCSVEGLSTDGGRCESIECKLRDGRKLRVKAKDVVVSGGAIASSWLLKQSRLGGPLVGANLAFNMGSPMTADFAEELHSYDGLQISHYLERPEHGFVFETWFNPVVSQALNMPGWFEDHYRNMHRYSHLTAAGVLVGTERNARIKRALTGGPDIVYAPERQDLDKLIEGLKLAGRIYLAAGAERVMPATFHYLEFTEASELDQLDDYVRDDRDLSLGTGHPQGGNAISADPNNGVVDPASFRVHGTENVYLCDASAFPSSITVNPQMTVMALAEYAAPLIGSA